MSIAVPNYNQYLGDQSGGLGGAGSPTSSLSVLGGGASGWINQYDSSSQQQQDGRPPNKRRLSDASNDSSGTAGGGGSSSKKSKILIGEAGTAVEVKDGGNKTKSGRFKPGAPVDLDEQCGVMTDKNVPCSRSLTCKTHGMGSKRALEGRSKPYDTLLAEFQKRKEVRLEAKKRNEAVREAEKAKQASAMQEQQQLLSSSMPAQQQYPGQQQQNGSQAYLNLPGQLNHLDNYIQQQQQPYLSQQQSQLSGPGKLPSPSQSQFQPLATMQNSQSSQLQAPQFSPKMQNQHQSPPRSSSSVMNKSLSKASSSQLQAPAGTSQKGSSGSAPTSSSKVNKSSNTGTGVNGNSKSSASTSANGSQQAVAGISSGKKKGTGERKRTTTKASKASKADLILGEVDDPPEPLPGSAAALAADHVEEEAPDSDDELEQLLMAIGNSRAKPLAVQQVPALHVGRAQRMIRLREGFTTAFTGRSLSSTVA